MMSFFDGFILELVPHCASVSPEGWTGDHNVRPLSEAGHRQAEALVGTLGTGVDAIYASPALRCLQTVRPLARAAGLSIVELVELLDTQRFAEPREWTQGIFKPVAEAVGGGWAAGRGLRALVTMAGRHPGGRVVASSHGDVIPAFFAMLCAASDVPLPAVPDRGGWYTVRFGAGSFTVTSNGTEYS
jgi:8-oxo-dGTP diphosphatase